MQLELLFLDAEELRRRLESASDLKLDLKLTNNTSTMMNFKRASGNRPDRLRLHQMFLSAGPEVIHAVGCWITDRRSRTAARAIDDFIEAHHHLVENRTRRINIRIQGNFHDLTSLYNEVNAKHFNSEIDVPITWGKVPGRRRGRRSIRLGSWCPSDRLIRIHPHLDQACVPDFFIRYIVFHEMLHVHVGHETSPAGRRLVHTPTFNRLERDYPDYERAVAWHDNPRNLSKLLNARRLSA